MIYYLPTSGAWPLKLPKTALVLAEWLTYQGVTVEPVGKSLIRLEGPDDALRARARDIIDHRDELRRLAIEVELPIVGPAH
jgi:hypothetical protein